MVADVIKSFDSVDRSTLDCALGRLGLLDWFRRVYFSYHSQVRLRFKLAAGLGGIFQGCPLSMVFIVALYIPWCRRLMLSLSFTLIILSAVRSVTVPSLMLLGLLLGMYVRLVKVCVLVSAFFLVPLSLLERL